MRAVQGELLHDIFNHSGLFAGYPNNVVPLHNVQAVESNKFYVIGRIIAMSLVQGGEAPACFSNAIADYLVCERISSPMDICDIPDHMIQTSLNAVSIHILWHNVSETLLIAYQYQFKQQCCFCIIA